MHQVILCRFDDKSESVLSLAQKTLASSGLSAPVDFPHLSLVSSMPFDGKFRRQHFRASFQAVENLVAQIDLSYLGVFWNKNGSLLYAGVTPTEKLMEISRLIYRYVDACGLETHPHFEPDTTVFHVTLGAQVPNHAMSDAVAICSKIGLPRCVRITSYCLYNYAEGAAVGEHIDTITVSAYRRR